MANIKKKILLKKEIHQFKNAQEKNSNITHDMKSQIIYIAITFWKYNVNCSILLLFYNKFL